MPAKGESEELQIQVGGSAERVSKDFESALAGAIVAELYPVLLENCTDEDDEIDTQSVYETLAGLVGLFIADYQGFYGPEKAMETFQNLIDLSLNMYEDRVADNEDEEG